MKYEYFVNNYQRYLKSPRTLSEALKDDMYCSAITRPKEGSYDWFYGVLMALLFSCAFGYGLFIYVSL
jgi:hypothetical protein